MRYALCYAVTESKPPQYRPPTAFQGAPTSPWASSPVSPCRYGRHSLT